MKSFFWSILLLFFLTANIDAESISSEQNDFPETPIIVSLGYACEAASAISELHLRKAAYPFDWLRTSFSALYDAIEDDFQHIFTELKFNENNQLYDYYGLEFAHDQITKSDQEHNNSNIDSDMYNAAKKKYDRRAERFISLCQSGKKIVFIRYGIMEFQSLKEVAGAVRLQEMQEAIQLKNLLKFKYPNLDFLLIVLSWDPNHEPWNIEGIRNFVHADTSTVIKQILLELSSDLLSN